ncbi:hypothetical protein Taro_051678, partial [Colocasia esculenta]|nr:hypothetical protein [Colocasia esculenta]
ITHRCPLCFLHISTGELAWRAHSVVSSHLLVLFYDGGGAISDWERPAIFQSRASSRTKMELRGKQPRTVVMAGRQQSARRQRQWGIEDIDMPALELVWELPTCKKALKSPQVTAGPQTY